MAARRILYGAALLAALLLLIFNDSYLAFFLLLCILLAPVLSLALSLPAILRLKLSVLPDREELVQGEDHHWIIRMQGRSPLPVARLNLRLSFQNGWTGQVREEALSFTGLAGNQYDILPMDTTHCGLLTVRILRVRALDDLGLFSFPLRPPAAASALVLPLPAGRDAITLPDLQRIPAGTGGRPRQTGEDEELRDYRPGDPLRSVHWKLSSKWNTLLVRERQGLERPAILITFDCFGTPGRMDLVLGRLWTVSQELTRLGYPQEIRWSPAAGELAGERVSSPPELTACMRRILSRPIPLSGQPVAELLPPAPERAQLHISFDEEETP